MFTLFLQSDTDMNIKPEQSESYVRMRILVKQYKTGQELYPDPILINAFMHYHIVIYQDGFSLRVFRTFIALEKTAKLEHYESFHGCTTLNGKLSYFVTKIGWNFIEFCCCRVPMNIITCGALMCLHIDAVSQDKRIVFAACLALSTIGQILSVP